MYSEEEGIVVVLVAVLMGNSGTSSRSIGSVDYFWLLFLVLVFVVDVLVLIDVLLL